MKSFQAGQRVRVTSAVEMDRFAHGQHAVVLDPPYTVGKGFLRVLLDNPTVTHPLLRGVALLHPEGLELE